MTTQSPLTPQEIERRERIRASLSEWWARLNQLSAAWDMEAGKHLIVLNAAGFAGVSTLLVGSKPIKPGWVGPTTLLCYWIAVILAILIWPGSASIEWRAKLNGEWLEPLTHPMTLPASSPTRRKAGTGA